MSDAGALLPELAVPRLTGTPAHAAVRDMLTRELEDRGLHVEVVPFEASAGPLERTARAMELVGFAALFFMSGAIAAQPGRGAKLALLPLGLAIVVARSRYSKAPTALGANLVATPSDGRARVWLVAHYDSKSQRFSMATRLIGVASLALQVPALIALAALMAAGVTDMALALLTLPALAGGALLGLADLKNRSPGAVDNASGVIAVLATIDRLSRGQGVGICFTDAEEWGLQGALALVRTRPELFRDAAVVNFDGLDDRGGTLLFAHRSGPLVARLASTAGVRARRWFPALVDGVAFARVARECVTIMRGNWGTARRIHTPRDDAASLRLDGVRRAAAVVADALAAA
jgi:peptidase M28-like protein